MVISPNCDDEEDDDDDVLLKSQEYELKNNICLLWNQSDKYKLFFFVFSFYAKPQNENINNKIIYFTSLNISSSPQV